LYLCTLNQLVLTIMKKVFCTLLAVVLTVTLFAQGKVSTRKYILNDFTDKVTRVVLTGNEVLDSGLRQEVVNNWTSSAFEFCTVADFEANKKSDLYYFLIPAESRFKDEEDPGIMFLTLVKGNPEAGEGLSDMTEIISLPLMAAAGGTGRELIYLGALVRGIQEFTLEAMESEKTAYSMDLWFNRGFAKEAKMKQIMIAEEDLAETVTPSMLERYLDDDMLVCSAQEADSAYIDGSYHTLTSYSVAPFMPKEGASYCYTMLFDAQSKSLCYIHRHKITKKAGTGFNIDDLKRIASKR